MKMKHYNTVVEKNINTDNFKSLLFICMSSNMKIDKIYKYYDGNKDVFQYNNCV